MSTDNKKLWYKNAASSAFLGGGAGLLIQMINLYIRGKSPLYLAAYACRTVFYPLNAMWYLLASIVGAWILTAIYLKSKNWKIVWLVYSCISYSFVLLCNNYFFLIEGTVFDPIIRLYSRVFVSARNGIFLAPVYMGFGFVLRDQAVFDWVNEHKNLSILGVLIGFVLLAIEATFLFKATPYDDRGYFLSQLLLIPSIVCAAVLHDAKWNLPFRLLRKLSMSIFCLHCTVQVIVISVLKMVAINGYDNSLAFLITLALSVIIALVVYRTKNKTLNKLIYSNFALE